MKTKNTPPVPLWDEKIIVYFPEMISLLMGKDAAARQAFRNDVRRRAEEIRMQSLKGNFSDSPTSNIIRFPMGYSCSA